MWRKFDVPDDCLPTSFDVDLTNGDFFRFCTASIVERLDEFSSHGCSLHTVSKIKVANLQITRRRKCRLGETIKTCTINGSSKHR